MLALRDSTGPLSVNDNYTSMYTTSSPVLECGKSLGVVLTVVLLKLWLITAGIYMWVR